MNIYKEYWIVTHPQPALEYLSTLSLVLAHELLSDVFYAEFLDEVRTIHDKGDHHYVQQPMVHTVKKSHSITSLCSRHSNNLFNKRNIANAHAQYSCEFSKSGGLLILAALIFLHIWTNVLATFIYIWSCDPNSVSRILNVYFKFSRIPQIFHEFHEL